MKILNLLKKKKAMHRKKSAGFIRQNLVCSW